MERISDKPRGVLRKTLHASAWGAIAGAAGTAGFLALADGGALGKLGGSEMAAALVALWCLLVTVAMGLGVLKPGFGARYLNVEDADELREQRALLGYAAASMGSMGAVLLALALAGSGGVLTSGAGLALAMLFSVLSIAFGIAQMRRADEMTRAVSRETGNLAFYLLFVIGGGWAMLAHLGFLVGPEPLDWVTMLTALSIVAAFVVAGRKGMLQPR